MKGNVRNSSMHVMRVSAVLRDHESGILIECHASNKSL